MTVLITLTLAGANSGPFNLYSNSDGYTTPFESNVNKAALQAGYSSALVPDTASVIRVVSVGDCVNFIDIPLTSITSSTSSTSSTSTSSTSTSSTTTTTTTDPYPYTFNISAAYPNATDACNLGTFVQPVKSNNAPLAQAIGSQIRQLFPPGPFPGGGNFYLVEFANYAIQINGSGIVTAVTPC